ncbi:MAG: 3',5'-cyclic-AMP phosphodiesterase [Hahellaceae bacterium]|nr:3',5'-cyclic-AMP phosphodiesterase [Hahellaceae bacterium]
MAKKGSSIKVVQITDCHLRAEAHGALLGMKTLESLDAVLELVEREQESPDLVLLTGDLAQDGSEGAYQTLRARMGKRFDCPVIWFMGNHDNASAMQSAAQGTDCLRKSLTLGDWHIICLDSSVPGKVHGKLEAAELAFLDAELQTHADKHVMVVFHHHPVAIGSAWMDSIGLRNGPDFLSVIDRFSHVRLVLWGHVHQAFDSSYNGVRLLASPSTCVQFKPLSHAFALDEAAPGYRRILLQPDGTLDTEVLRVDHIEFEVDLDSKGY